MNAELKNILLRLAVNPLDLSSVQTALADLTLEGWEKTLATRVINAKTPADLFKVFFQVTPKDCFAEISNTLIKPLLIAYTGISSAERPVNFYTTIYTTLDRFGHDKDWLPQILTELSPQEVNSVFANASEEDVRQLFVYLKDYLKDKYEPRLKFSSQLTKATWLQFLNNLGIDDLSEFNLATAAKQCPELYQALADWLMLNYKNQDKTFWDFVEKQQLLVIPGLVDLLLKNESQQANDFHSAFINRTNPDQDLLLSFFMPATLDTNAPFPIDQLGLYDQLLAYGLLSVYLGQKQKLLDATRDQNGQAAIDVAHAREIKEKYLQQSPLLKRLNQEQIFPLNLIPALAEYFEDLTERDVKDCLWASECLAFTIEDWIAQYGKGWMASKNWLIIDKRLSREQITTLARALKTNNTIKKLKLRDCEINGEDAAILAKVFETNTTLTELDLSGNQIDDAGAKAFADVLTHNTTLKALDLSYNKIGDAGAIALANTLKIDMNLDLSSNRMMGEDGIKAWMSALESNRVVTKISLKMNKVNNLSSALFSLLEKNTIINKLVINTNYGDKDNIIIMQELATMLPTTSLQSIQLNGVGDKGARALAKALETNTTLLTVTLSCTLLTNEGARALADMLKTNTTLTTLELWPLEKLDEKILTEIKASLKRNQDYYNLHREINTCLESAKLPSYTPNINPKLVVASDDSYSTSYSTMSAELELLKKRLDRLEIEMNKKFNFPEKIIHTSKEEFNILENTIHTSEAQLTTALETAKKLCDAKPRYPHAEALFHEVQCKIASAYAIYGDYEALIQLYFEYFIDHPDDLVNLELASLLIRLEDEEYLLVGLKLETDKQQLILSVLAGNKKPEADFFRVQALHVLKGRKGMSSDTFATIAGVTDGIIITFAELVSLTEQLNQPEENNEGIEQETLLQKIKTDKVKVYVYEQLIMEPAAAPQLVKFNPETGMLNQDVFKPYADRVTTTKNSYLIRLNSSTTRVLARLSHAIQQNYGKNLNTFSVWHSRTLTARRLASLPTDLPIEELRLILEVELSAKQRELGLNSRPKSHSFFPSVQKRNLVDMLQETLDSLPASNQANDDTLLATKKELAELLLSWVDTEERSLPYKLFHSPNKSDALSERIKTAGELAHQILRCKDQESLSNFKDQVTHLELDDDSQAAVTQKFAALTQGVTAILL